MVPHLDIPVSEASQVGEARRAVLRLAQEQRLDETACGRVALVVTELGTNLVRHAAGGRLLLGCHAVPEGCQLEVVSIDSGPGMADVDRCLRDGYSSGNTPGTGLGAVRRLSTDFSVFSAEGRGTVILSRAWVPALSVRRKGVTPSRFSHAGLCLAAPGETISGDAWEIRIEAGRALLMVADGLGHGPAAAEAADVAMRAFRTGSGTPHALLEQAHPLMRGTQGAAVAVIEADADAGTVVFAGAGNVAGRLISGVSDRSLMSQQGTLGLQIGALQDVACEWPPHALLILHSDGLAARWDLRDVGGLLQCDPAVVAGWLIRDHARVDDDVTVVVLKRG